MDGLLIGDRIRDKPVALLGAACGLGARDGGCADGPTALRRAGALEHLRARGLTAGWIDTLAPAQTAGAESGSVIADLCGRLAEGVSAAVSSGARIATIGGDHSLAVGTWTGAANALAPAGRLGLVWVDAHMDSHTPQTTHSGAWHGMPLACLLGHGDARLTGLARPGPALAPGHVCLVGVRSYEAEEAALLDRLGVRVYTAGEVARRGLAPVMREACAIALDGTAGAGLSLDLDAIDPREAPGVGSPEPDGLAADDLLRAVALHCRDERFIGCEIAEYNPARDRNGRTAELAIGLLGAFFAAPDGKWRM